MLVVKIDEKEFIRLNNEGYTNIQLSKHFKIGEHHIRHFRKILCLESKFVPMPNNDWENSLLLCDATLISKDITPFMAVVKKGNYDYNVDLRSIKKLKWTFHNMTYDSKLNYINSEKLKNTPFKAIEVFKDAYLKIKIINLDNNNITTVVKNFKVENIFSLTTKSETKLDNLKNIFGDKYDYSKTVYVHSREKSTVTCKTHGDFMLDWSNAFQKSTGCPKCANILKGYGRSNFINVANSKNVLGCLYFIKLKEDNEVFYKIGITTNTIKQRSLSIPYSKENILLVCGDAKDIYDLEKFIHKKFGSFSYLPEKYFRGRMECFEFNDELKITEYIKQVASKIVKNLCFN